jgi:hypothetical protein
VFEYEAMAFDSIYIIFSHNFHQQKKYLEIEEENVEKRQKNTFEEDWSKKKEAN